MRYDPPDLLSPPHVFERAFQRAADLFTRLRRRRRDRDEARAQRRRRAQTREENRK